ncbi:MAG: V-type ATPase subunit [Clostridia bacterium]
MANSSLVYSNARVKAMENSLLSLEKITRMMYAETLEDGIKVLYESNYGGTTLTNANDYETLLKNEETKLSNFLIEAMPKNSGLEIFIAKLDYQNAKALCKAKYLKLDDAQFMMASQGFLNINTLKEAIFTDSYGNLPAPMQTALKEIDNNFITGDKSAKFVDVQLDRAMFKELLSLVKRAKAKSIKKYVVASIDFANIGSFLRCKRIGAEVKYFKSMFIEGGELDLYDYDAVYDQNVDAFAEKFRFSFYGKMLGQAVEEMKKTNSLVNFETMQDDFLLDLFKDDRHDVFSIAPIAGYFIAKKTEQKVIRMILVCLKNKVDKQLIKQRLREIYA